MSEILARMKRQKIGLQGGMSQRVLSSILEVFMNPLENPKKVSGMTVIISKCMELPGEKPSCK